MVTKESRFDGREKAMIYRIWQLLNVLNGRDINKEIPTRRSESNNNK